MKPPRPRVAITGVGVVSALGLEAPTTFEALCVGRVGIDRVAGFDVAGLRCQLAAEVHASFEGVGDPEWSRSDRLAWSAAREALARAGFPVAPRDMSLAVGGTTGGMREAEAVLIRGEVLTESCARRLLSYPLSTTAERLGRDLGLAGHTASVCSACSSGANAIALAASWVETGRAESVLAGGTDALCRLTFVGFNALGVMSETPCRPFDVGRSGLTLGEGAAFLVLESEAHARARGADIWVWLDGFALGSEAHHITHPEPNAARAAKLISTSLSRAGLGASDVDYVNAHGTATQKNDESEALALRLALGAEVERVLVSSQKGQVGHTLGAAGAIEAAITVLALRHGDVPPSGGLVTPDPSLGLRHVVGCAEHARPRVAISTSFGFGGAGTVLTFVSPERIDARNELPLPSLGVAAISLQSGADSRGALARLDPARSRRFDLTSALVSAGAGHLLEQSVPQEEVGLVLGTAYGNVERTVEYLQRIVDRGPRFAAPADFPHLLPSAAAGNASIYLGLRGPVLSVADLATSSEAAWCTALALLEAGHGRRMVAGGAESEDAVVARVLAPLWAARTPGAARGSAASLALLAAESDPMLARIEYWSDSARPEHVPPPAPECSLVLAPDLDGVAPFIALSPWRAAPQRQVEGDDMPMEVRGGVALAQAVETIRSGNAKRVLVVSVGRRGHYAFVLAEGAAA